MSISKFGLTITTLLAACLPALADTGTASSTNTTGNAEWAHAFLTGQSAHEHNNFAEAEAKYMKAVDIAKAFPPHDPRLVTALQNAASCMEEQAKYSESEGLWKQVITIFEHNFGGDDNTFVANSYMNLGTSQRNQGHPIEAEASFKKALGIYSKLLPVYDPHIPTVLGDIGQMMVFQGNVDDGMKVLRRAHNICTRNIKLGYNDQIQVRDKIDHDLSYCFLSKGEIAQASAYFTGNVYNAGRSELVPAAGSLKGTSAKTTVKTTEATEKTKDSSTPSK